MTCVHIQTNPQGTTNTCLWLLYHAGKIFIQEPLQYTSYHHISLGSSGAISRSLTSTKTHLIVCPIFPEPNHPTQGPSFAQRMKPFEPRPTTPDIEHGSPRWPYTIGKSSSKHHLSGSKSFLFLCHELKPPRLRDPMILWFTHIFQGKIPKKYPMYPLYPMYPMDN